MRSGKSRETLIIPEIPYLATASVSFSLRGVCVEDVQGQKNCVSDEHSIGLNRTLTLAWRGWTKACPRCGGRSLFQRWFTLRERCPHCGLRFEREEGYWTGAIAANVIVTELLFVTLMILAFLFATATIVRFTPRRSLTAPAAIPQHRPAGEDRTRSASSSRSRPPAGVARRRPRPG
jgi:uncharacterized protein (DUF983 family)